MAAWWTGDYVTSMLVFQGEKRSAQASAHPLSPAFVCFVLWEFWLRLNEIHEVRTCAPCKGFFVVVVVLFSSPENYFGFRTTNVSVKTDHSVSRRRNKTFWTFPIVHSICELILCPVLRLLSPGWIKTRLYSVISSYGEFFTCPDLFTFVEPALSLSYVKTVLNANAWEWTNLSA